MDSAKNEARASAAVDRLIASAVAKNASDIHLEPTAAGGAVRIRVDGALQDGEVLGADEFAELVGRLKAMADMDVAEHRLPQEGQFQVMVGGVPYNLRAGTAPLISGERLVLRILSRQGTVLALEDIGLRDVELEQVKTLCQAPYGLVVCSGPSGSGKTTLLYAMLGQVDRRHCCVMSIEDPVEYRLDGVAQIAIRPRIGVTFARAAQAVLRQDPDVIMIGEIRDLEMLQAAVEIALTGHLVLTQFHAATAPGAIRRLLDLGIEPYRITAAVRGIIAQRLVRVVCTACREKTDLDVNMLPSDVLSHPAGKEFLSAAGSGTFCVARGCDQCQGSGYRGRTAIHEIILPGKNVQRAVMAAADDAALREAALADGMKPMIINGLEKAALGITSVEEVVRTVGAA